MLRGDSEELAGKRALVIGGTQGVGPRSRRGSAPRIFTAARVDRAFPWPQPSPQHRRGYHRKSVTSGTTVTLPTATVAPCYFVIVQ